MSMTSPSPGAYLLDPHALPEETKLLSYAGQEIQWGSVMCCRVDRLEDQALRLGPLTCLSFSTRFSNFLVHMVPVSHLL